MDYKIIFSPEFESDLDETLNVLADFSTCAVKSFYDKLIKQTELLRLFPYMHSIREDLGGELRIASIKKYNLYYRINEDKMAVEFVRLAYGALPYSHLR